MKRITEQDVEDAALDILENELDYSYVYGPDISPGGEGRLERQELKQVILKERLSGVIAKLNPELSVEKIEEVIKKIQRLNENNLIKNNKKFHEYITQGVPIEIRKKGEIRHLSVKIIDFKNPKNNDFLATNQFTVTENKNNRRPDIIIFINGLPIGIIELKNPRDEKATITSAYNQLETYKQELPTLFTYNELLIISDGIKAQAGNITSARKWFLPWKTINGEKIEKLPELEVLLKGMFQKEIIIDIIKNFITYTKNGKKENKILAGYHQYHATNKSLKKTIKAIKGNKKIGIVWHTQGSGKSLVLALYFAKLQQEEELKNPTLIILTDRNDLDNQLFDTFSTIDCLRTKPTQILNKKDLKQKLKEINSGGIFFTTIQKFGTENEIFEELSKRENIIIAVDEAHRTQYGFKGRVNQKSGKINYGFAKYIRDAFPNASFIGFTGTPIELSDRSTKEVFGDYIDVYDIRQAIEDERIVKTYYESRISSLDLKSSEICEIDKDFEEVTENEEQENKQKLISNWSRFEKIVGSNKRIKRIAKDVIKHFNERQRVLKGKAMIVCMSRRICVELYNEIKKLKPEWVNSSDDDKGFLKTVMTGSASDGPLWQEHIRSSRRRKELGNIFKDNESEFKLAIVRDMWLTGFDVPSLNTIYIDKPMKGHGLMQAIARVNRLYKGKEGGLVVDYLGFGRELEKAMISYTTNRSEKPVLDVDEAVLFIQEKYEVVKKLFHGFDYKKFFTRKPKERLRVMLEAMEYILKQKDVKKRYIKQVTLLNKAYSLAPSNNQVIKYREDIAFFETIKLSLVKNTEKSSDQKTSEELDFGVSQIISKYVTSGKVIDLFEIQGLKKPEISILSDKFLNEIKNMKQKNLAFETLKKLLNDEVKSKFKHNIIKSRRFSKMLQETLLRYQNRSLDTSQLIQELIELAKKMREKGMEGLSKEEEAFYDALNNHETARKILGENKLKEMAKELIKLVNEMKTVDWNIRKDIQAKLRVMVKRLLKKYGYPPDKQQIAIDLIIKQSNSLAEDES